MVQIRWECNLIQRTEEPASLYNDHQGWDKFTENVMYK